LKGDDEWWLAQLRAPPKLPRLQTKRSRVGPRPTLRSGRGSRINSIQTQARVIEASRNSNMDQRANTISLCAIRLRATAAGGAGVPGAIVMPHLDETGSARVVTPDVEIEEAA